MKKLFAIILTFVLIFNLSACSNIEENISDNPNLEELFLEHLKTELNLEGNVFKTNSLELYEDYIKIDIEEREWEYRIVVTMCEYLSPNNEQFFNISLNELKNEMKNFAEYFITFAKEQNLDNDYYLYTQITDLDFHFVYDYEQNKLYYPKRYDVFLEMLREFDTIDDNKIAETEYGQNWLVEKNCGEIKHHEYESFIDTVGNPQVYIDEKGKFSSWFLDEYI